MEHTMRAPIIDPVSERLDRLDRELRAWRGIGLVAALGAGLLLLTGMAPSGPPTVAAQRFVVIDKNGAPRVSLGLLSEDGSPVMQFTDKDGVTHVSIGLVNGEPEVTLTSSDGRVRWTIPPVSAAPIRASSSLEQHEPERGSSRRRGS